jgi:hypothetical protein
MSIIIDDAFHDDVDDECKNNVEKDFFKTLSKYDSIKTTAKIKTPEKKKEVKQLNLKTQKTLEKKIKEEELKKKKEELKKKKEELEKLKKKINLISPEQMRRILKKINMIPPKKKENMKIKVKVEDIEDLKDIEEIETETETETEDIEEKYFGYPNFLRSNCFINAAIQCITEPILDYVNIFGENNQREDDFIKSLIKVIMKNKIEKITQKDEDLEKLIIESRLSTRQETGAGDSNLLLNFWLERDSIFKNFFKTFSYLSYSNPMIESHYTIEPYLIDLLDLGDDLNLQNIMNEILYTEEILNHKTNIKNIMLPRYLCIEYTNMQVSELKVDYSVKFPIKLKFFDCDYDLISVGYNNSEGKTGHCYARTKRDDGKWYEFNDSSVSEMDINPTEMNEQYVSSLIYRKII